MLLSAVESIPLGGTRPTINPPLSCVKISLLWETDSSDLLPKLELELVTE